MRAGHVVKMPDGGVAQRVAMRVAFQEVVHQIAGQVPAAGAVELRDSPFRVGNVVMSISRAEPDL